MQITIRPGARDDVPAVLALLDGATEWLVSRGQVEQWGTAPHSTSPRRVAQISGFAADGELWVAELDGRVVGALAVGAAMEYVPPADEPELYVRLLVTDRASAGRNLGGVLLDHARDLARAAGVRLLRVDCFAGGDGALVRYYEKQGFTREAEFAVSRVNEPDWPGQLLTQHL
ncbi:GNAT family N-acetyltransferase [Kribbella solani]|uniref:GNAT superfamily N-acetyltransferase n=1 Tax=Kribbella solani TaxID=236067 RepID=A0A841DV65_9ACTN|nr:GNAT family N-acetyltransferase [Kribbella solani]MBB5980167.1 GNAT superfamily N-acetyltransferase [Kribbella solani]MDX2971391.1 GNAT family N-acetyltransferase [Kribbella solani]MDX3005470.1 GNAT family N-acetyltransferase [Kribbella solani]